ncbi:MAG: SCO family protein [Bdellovibrionota bacterium]
MRGSESSTVLKCINLSFGLLFFCTPISWGAPPPAVLEGVGITEKSGATLSIHDLKFRDEQGKDVLLSNYFKSGKPVLLSLVYYECPGLCTFVLNGLVAALHGMDWTPGNQFELLTVSINPRESSKLAATKKTTYIENLGKPEVAGGWHFLTGSEDQIKRLADQIGFGFKYDPKEKQFAHGSAIFALTPEGKISRYLYGVSYSPKDVRLALLEASSGKIGNVIDRLLLFCYTYNPLTRKYAVYSTRLIQAGSAGTGFFFGGFLAIYWNRQRRREFDSHAE